MLNRHALRAKAMQTVFAWQINQEGLRQAAFAVAEQALEPDYFRQEDEIPLHTLQDQKERAEAAMAHYLTAPEAGLPPATNEDIAFAVEKGKNFLEKERQKTKNYLRQSLLRQTEGVYHHFIRCLYLLNYLGQAARNTEKNKYLTTAGQDESRLAENRVLRLLADHPQLPQLRREWGVETEDLPDLARSLYKNALRHDEQLLAYLRQGETSPEEDLELVKYFFKELLSRNQRLEEHFLQRDSLWEEHQRPVLELLKKALKFLRKSEFAPDFQLPHLTTDWPADRRFLQDLFDKTLERQQEYNQLIAQQTQNWKLERIAGIDRACIQLALTEMIDFFQIPVKVTINEYVELCKAYSTPKSFEFVNGLLDALAQKLKNEGRIRKSAIGMLDNS